MKRRTAIAIKLLATLFFHSERASHFENYEPVLYTEKRMVRMLAPIRGRAMTYGVLRGEKLNFNIRHAFHRLHRCWRWCMMRLNFSY